MRKPSPPSFDASKPFRQSHTVIQNLHEKGIGIPVATYVDHSLDACRMSVFQRIGDDLDADQRDRQGLPRGHKAGPRRGVPQEHLPADAKARHKVVGHILQITADFDQYVLIFASKLAVQSGDRHDAPFDLPQESHGFATAQSGPGASGEFGCAQPDHAEREGSACSQFGGSPPSSEHPFPVRITILALARARVAAS